MAGRIARDGHPDLALDVSAEVGNRSASQARGSFAAGTGWFAMNLAQW